ncbi:hypothetical protein [Nocardia sp. NPDC127526]|uniref:hypothetical protein n=1 Tax=Nocardia sp. NPDC127526 TaxID=3345393 RepID=UPI00363B0DCE
MNYPQPEPYPGRYEPYTPVVSPVPDTVRNAFYLMVGGGVATVLQTVWLATQYDEVREDLRLANPGIGEAELDSLVTGSFVGALIGTGVSVVLWLWIAFACRAGKNWARVTGTVFFGINAFFVALAVLGVLGPTDAIGVVINAAIVLIGLAAVIQLWSSRSAEYFL